MVRHLTLIPIGSRGDVQPFVALGRALKSAGHAVRIATHDTFEGFVRAAGLEFVSVGGDPHQIVHELMPRLAAKNPLVAVPAMLEVLSQLITKTLHGVSLCCQDTDAVVASYPALYAALEATERARVPLILGSLHPATSTAHARHLLLPQLPRALPLVFQHLYNRFSHWAADELLFRLMRRPIDAARAAQLGWAASGVAPIRAVHARRLPILHPFSARLVPVPPDWPDYVHVTGFWFLQSDPTFAPPSALTSFLSAGPPPLYVGFGSVGPKGDDALRRIVDVLVRRRQRALIAAPAERFGSGLPAHIVTVGALPHGWLFPQLGAAIHHGGVGTTGEALRTGIPMATVTFSVEQHFWGQAAHALGVAAPPIAVQRLTPAAAEALVARVTEGSLLRAATASGSMVRAERGLERAVELIERSLRG